MSGDHYRDAISARADGEDPGVADELIDAHIAVCESCRDFDHAAYRLRRRLGIYDTSGVPDMAREVVDNVTRDDRRRSPQSARWLLGACAIPLIVLSVPDFLAVGPGAHSLRHLGAFRLAYAVGLLGVVVRPARARAMFGVSVVLVVALVATTTVDLVRGHVEPLPETIHLLQIATAVLLWVLTRPRGAYGFGAPGTAGSVQGRAVRAGLARSDDQGRPRARLRLLSHSVDASTQPDDTRHRGSGPMPSRLTRWTRRLNQTRTTAASE